MKIHCKSVELIFHSASCRLFISKKLKHLFAEDQNTISYFHRESDKAAGSAESEEEHAEEVEEDEN